MAPGLKKQTTAKKAASEARPGANGSRFEFPAAESSGYLVRDAHRALQWLLGKRIADYGITRGQWYFLRALWSEDGLSQRALSARVGMMEPTTVIALRSMEKAGLVRRVRSADDKRKAEVWLTPKAKRMRDELLKVARSVTVEAEVGIAPDDIRVAQRVLAQMTANLDRMKR